jgi:hypothetical protein
MNSVEHRGNDTDKKLRHLVVIAGPSCVGKSTVVSRLIKGELPALAESLGVMHPETFAVVHAAAFKRDRSPAEMTGDVFLHYELTRTRFVKTGAQSDHALHILDQARRIDFLTLWEDPQTIAMRFRAKVRRSMVDALVRLEFRLARRVCERFLIRRRYFADPKQMWALYCQWFDACDKIPAASHWTFRSSQEREPPRRLDSRAHAFWEVQHGDHSVTGRTNGR